MMARFRRQMAIRPVNRIKHVIDIQQGVTQATPAESDLVLAQDAPELQFTNTVLTGSTVNAVYLNVEAYTTNGVALSNIYMAVYKNPGGNITFPNANAVGGDDNKRFVIHQEMKMLQTHDAQNSSIPRTIFNGVIVIPKGYRRFAPNDKLTVQFFLPGADADVCFQCHYKEFR